MNSFPWAAALSAKPTCVYSCSIVYKIILARDLPIKLMNHFSSHKLRRKEVNITTAVRYVYNMCLRTYSLVELHTCTFIPIPIYIYMSWWVRWQWWWPWYTTTHDWWGYAHYDNDFYVYTFWGLSVIVWFAILRAISIVLIYTLIKATYFSACKITKLLNHEKHVIKIFGTVIPTSLKMFYSLV